MMIDKFEHEDELDKSVEIVGSGTQMNNLNEGFVEFDSSKDDQHIFKIERPGDDLTPMQCDPTITSVPYADIRYPNSPPEEGVLIQQKQE